MDAIIELLKQLVVAVPTVIASTLLLTEAIKRIIKIETPWVNHLISWVISVGVSLLFVLTGQLSFGFGGWDYAIGAVFGLIAGGASNGLYDWEAVRALVQLIIDLFGKGIRKLAGKNE